MKTLSKIFLSFVLATSAFVPVSSAQSQIMGSDPEVVKAQVIEQQCFQDLM